jgi:ABC-type branched-subunit amino acid transport system ATPase component
MAAVDGAEILRVEGVVGGYSTEVDILNGLDLTVRRGEIVTIIGPNGAGKSTLIKAVCGLVTPRKGRILWRGEDITGVRPHRIVRQGIGYVPQEDHVFATLTVQENLEVARQADPSMEVDARLEEVFDLFPRLRERRRSLAGTMSGGERQMLAMARPLMARPALLLLDEPSAGVAPAIVELVFEKIRRLNDAGATVLMVEQNARAALAMSDRGYVLDLGRCRHEGEAHDLLHDRRIAELYLGGLARSCGSEAR